MVTQAETAGAAKREAAIAARKAREKADREAAARLELQARNREDVAYRLKVMRHEQWQRNADQAARNIVFQQHRQALIADLERTINPPVPQEPQIIVVEQPGEELGAFSFVKAVSWRPKPI